MSTPAEFLAVDKLSKTFGSVVAAADISVRFQAGETVAMIGANGAGKTTFVNLVTGYLKPSSGQIRFLGQDITGLRPRAIARRGICRSFQTAQIVSEATVYENLLLALGIAEAGALPLWSPLETPRRREETDRLLEHYRLGDYAHRPAGQLPQGARKLLDVAMATARRPTLLLLDEPTSGVATAEKFPLMDIIVAALRAQEMSIIFIEHDMDIVAGYADRIIAFVDGRIVADGPPQDVMNDLTVRTHVIGLHYDPQRAARQPNRTR
jgi:branched-chain amino acid transport system ATP-binding protein